MTENEMKLRRWIQDCSLTEGIARQRQNLLDAALAERRDAALEEGIQAIDGCFENDLDTSAQDVLRALKSQPARRFLDAEEVKREARRLLAVPSRDADGRPINATAQGWARGINRLMDALGLDLGAEPGPCSQPKACDPETPGVFECPVECLCRCHSPLARRIATLEAERDAHKANAQTLNIELRDTRAELDRERKRAEDAGALADFWAETGRERDSWKARAEQAEAALAAVKSRLCEDEDSGDALRAIARWNRLYAEAVDRGQRAEFANAALLDALRRVLACRGHDTLGCKAAIALAEAVVQEAHPGAAMLARLAKLELVLAALRPVLAWARRPWDWMAPGSLQALEAAVSAADAPPERICEHVGEGEQCSTCCPPAGRS